MQIFKTILKTKITFYVFLFIALCLFISLPENIRTSQQKVLNRLVPDNFNALFAKDSSDELLGYIDYFDQVIKLSQINTEFPHALGLKAYCYQKLGNSTKAIDYYQRAVNQLPDYFWYSYNLAAIYFNNGYDQKVIEVLEPILKADLSKTINRLHSSKLFFQIIQNSQNQNVDFVYELEKGVVDAYQMIWFSYRKQNQWQKLLDSTKDYLEKNLVPTDDFYYYQSLALTQLGQGSQTINSVDTRQSNLRPTAPLRIF